MLLTPPPSHSGDLSPIVAPQLSLRNLELATNIEEEAGTTGSPRKWPQEGNVRVDVAAGAFSQELANHHQPPGRIKTADEQILTPDEELRVRISDLLVEATSNVMTARENREPGEQVEDKRHIPVRLLKRLYSIPSTETLDVILHDDHLSKAEKNWEKLTAYAAELMTWVEVTRSGTLIPMLRAQNKRKRDGEIERNPGLVVDQGGKDDDAASQAAASQRPLSLLLLSSSEHKTNPLSVDQKLAYVQTKVEDLNRELNALESRIDECSLIGQHISRICAMKFNRQPCSDLLASKEVGRQTSAEKTNRTLVAFQNNYNAQTAKIQWLRRQATEIDFSGLCDSQQPLACICLTEPDINNAIDELMKGLNANADGSRKGVGARHLHQYIEQMKEICAAHGKIVLGNVVDIADAMLKPVMQDWQALVLRVEMMRASETPANLPVVAQSRQVRFDRTIAFERGRASSNGPAEAWGPKMYE